MLTKKSRMTSLVAIAATVMLVFSTNAANAVSWSGYKSCTTNQVGAIEAKVMGSGNVRAPGASWKHAVYFYYPGYFDWAEGNQRGQRGGSWSVYASSAIGGVNTFCINGNF